MRKSVASAFRSVLESPWHADLLPLFTARLNLKKTCSKDRSFSSVLIRLSYPLFTQPGKMVWITADDKVPIFKTIFFLRNYYLFSITSSFLCSRWLLFFALNYFFLFSKYILLIFVVFGN